MKKKLVFFLLMLSINSLSQESLTIDEVLNRVENNRESYEFKSFQNTKEATDIKMTENNFEYRDRKYNKTFQNKASYGPFFVNYNFVEKDKSYVSYGVEKNLKDILYSKYDSNLKINNYQQELNKISYDKNIQTKKMNLVSLYQDILNSKNELEYRKKAYDHYRVDLEKLKKSYELGASPKINLESVELEAEDSKLQIDILETKLRSLYEIGKTDYDIDFENYKLIDFIDNNESIEKLLANYMEKDIAELKLNLSVAEERKKYNNYDRYMPDLYLAYERVDRNLRGDRYYRDQKIRLVDAEKIKLKAEYYELRKLASIGDKKSNIAYKKYLIKEKEYELNKASYLDVIDEYNKYLSQEIETKKARNSLNAFVYKIKIKR